MPKPLSKDLRHRIVAAVEAGGGMRAVAARYDVSPSSVSNISRLWRATGSIAAKPMGGDRRSHKTEAHGAQILGWFPRPRILRSMRSRLRCATRARQ